MYSLAKITCGSLAASLVLMAAPSVFAAHESVETMTHRLHAQSRNLAIEIRDSYRFSPEHRHLVADAVAVMQSAEHLHEQAHDGANLGHLHRDLHEFERDLSHLGRRLRDAEVHTGHFGHSDHIAWGRIGVNVRFAPDTRSVYRILHAIEETAQRLDNEIERLASRPRSRDVHNLNGYAYPLGGGRPGGPAWSVNAGGVVIRLGR